MGIQDNLTKDLNNIFYNTDVFFGETVSYGILQEDRSYIESEIIVNLSRKSSFENDDGDSGRVLPGHVFIRKSDIFIPKYGDKITDSEGVVWTLEYRMSEEFGLHKWMVFTDSRIRFNRQ
ncbi:MAG: hypothetical protein ABIJ17_02570 [Patescibacteria group bacterium]